MINQWFKFYGAEYLSDQKIDRLNPVERSCWLTLLCLASTNDTGEIKHLTVQTLLNKSGVQFDPYNTSLWEDSLGIFEKLEMLEMIERTDVNTIIIKNWSKRQNTAMTPYERLKKHRQNKVKSECDNEMITSDNGDDNDRREEKRREEKREEYTDVVVDEKIVSHEPLKRSSKAKSKKIDLLQEVYEPLFQDFWAIYPEKVAKGKAYDTWKLLTEEVKQLCITAIKNQVQNNHFYKEWKKEDVPPHPTTWLNQRRWEDTVKQITKPEQLKVITV